MVWRWYKVGLRLLEGIFGLLEGRFGAVTG